MIRQFLLCLVLLPSAGFAQTEAEPQELPTLREVAQWIGEQTPFPQDARQYGVVGTEQFVVSAAWDGRVFISSPLRTLNPAFEQAIRQTVRRAPRCRVEGMTADATYELIEIDFADRIPEADRNVYRPVGRHTFPAFPKQRAQEEGRELFVGWLSDRLFRTRRFAPDACADTIGLRYTISASGELIDCAVTGCRDASLRQQLERGMKKSPKWRPAVAPDFTPLAVTIDDRILLHTDEAGQPDRLELLRDEVCRNSSAAPDDPERLVPNPETKPHLQGDFRSIRQLLAAQVAFEQPTVYACSFVVERDGSISGLHVETADEQLGRTIADALRQTRWDPGMQGGTAVRTPYALREKRGPRREYETHYAPLDAAPRFLTTGSRPPFDYGDKAMQRRWKRFKRAYPEAEATLHGYTAFCRLDQAAYTEALVRRNASHTPSKLVEKRPKKKR